jgi:ribosome-associated protein
MLEEPLQNELIITPEIRVPTAELHFRAVRSSGPGGQNVNKVSTKIMLRWNVDQTQALPPDVMQRLRSKHRNRITTAGYFVISSERYRDQPRNRQDSIDKLIEILIEASIAPKKRTKTKPSKGSKERRLQAKKKRSETKQGRKNFRPE